MLLTYTPLRRPACNTSPPRPARVPSPGVWCYVTPPPVLPGALRPPLPRRLPRARGGAHATTVHILDRECMITHAKPQNIRRCRARGSLTNALGIDAHAQTTLSPQCDALSERLHQLDSLSEFLLGDSAGVVFVEQFHCCANVIICHVWVYLHDRIL